MQQNERKLAREAHQAKAAGDFIELFIKRLTLERRKAGAHDLIDQQKVARNHGAKKNETIKLRRG